MKLTEFLRKPRWLSKDAATRREAVAHDDDSELVAYLGRLAREDTDADVRVAAIKRLADPGIAQGMARDDTDPRVREQARSLWLGLLAGAHPAAPTLSERRRLLAAQDDDALIEHVARHGSEADLRRDALRRVRRPALLFERALEDADATVRIMLVEQIEDQAQLGRLAERARKSDKQVSRRARERIEELRLAGGDEVALQQHARSLCEALERLVRNPGHAEAEVGILARWQEIGAQAPAELRERFSAGLDLLASSRTIRPQQLDAADPDESIADQDVDVSLPSGTGEGLANVEQCDAAPSKESIEAVVVPLLAQARIAASIDEVNSQSEKQRELQRGLIEELGKALDAVNAAIDAGASAQAHSAKALVDDLRRRIEADLPRALTRRLADTEQRHGEISRWQHWADNKRRRQICEEIEALAGAGLHPDAVASRVRDSQVEWTRLDATEARQSARPDGLSRQFHAACRAALAPAQAYFRKRQELRQSHAQDAQALMQRVVGLTTGEGDRKTVVASRRDVVEALRGLDRVEPRERKALAQGLKDALQNLDALLESGDTGVERAKAALIAEAQKLDDGPSERGAVAAARELQQRWQRAGNGRRSRDQAQWKAFRAAIDAVFGKLDAQRAERAERDAGARNQAEGLCAEFEDLADAEQSPERGVITRLQSAWDALGIRDPTLENRINAAKGRLRDAAQRHERKQRHAQFETWLGYYRLCRAAESRTRSIDELRQLWADVAPGDLARDELTKRFDSALTDVPVLQDNAKALREILLQLELLAGIESEADDREQRRSLQVSRLAARLRGEATLSTGPELASLLERWTALGAVADNRIESRFERSVATILESLP